GPVDHAQRAVAQGRVVGHQLADVVDQDAAHPLALPLSVPVHRGVTASIAARSAAGTSTRTCRPSRTTTVPPTTTCRTSVAVAVKTTAAGSVPAVRTLSVATVTRSARYPGAITPASSHPRAR